MSEDRFENPWSWRPSSHEYVLWEALKNGARLTNQQINQQFTAVGLKPRFNKTFAAVNAEGLRPKLPDYPVGRWHLQKENSKTRLVFHDKIEKVPEEV